MSIGIKDTKRKRSSMKNIQKLILEAYGDIKEEKETIKLDTLPKAMQDRLKDRYGEFSKHDFISSDMGTYFKTTGVNKTTGQVSHKIIALPSFANLYNEYKSIIDDIKSLMRSDDVRKDKEARELFELIKTNFRKLQRYLRTERPEQYELIRMRASLQEIHEMFISHASLIIEQRAHDLKLGRVKNIDIFVQDQSSFTDTMFYILVDTTNGKEYQVGVDVGG
jgi:ribosomal protein S15P/S13E